jgi:hypothetical protein
VNNSALVAAQLHLAAEGIASSCARSSHIALTPKTAAIKATRPFSYEILGNAAAHHMQFMSSAAPALARAG